MKEKMREYVVTKTGVRLKHPKTGENVTIPVGEHIILTDAKAKALVNKVELVVEGFSSADLEPTGDTDTKADTDDTPTGDNDTKADDTPPPPPISAPKAKKGK